MPLRKASSGRARIRVQRRGFQHLVSEQLLFSFAFSSSSAFSRFASEASIPPYLAFQLWRVASEIPRRRASPKIKGERDCQTQWAGRCQTCARPFKSKMF